MATSRPNQASSFTSRLHLISRPSDGGLGNQAKGFPHRREAMFQGPTLLPGILGDLWNGVKGAAQGVGDAMADGWHWFEDTFLNRFLSDTPDRATPGAPVDDTSDTAPLSYRAGLGQIGIARDGDPLQVVFPHSSAFSSWPWQVRGTASLRSAIQAMQDLRVGDSFQIGNFVGEGHYKDHPWTEECQGVATDGSYWYISSNNSSRQGIYKFAPGMALKDFFPTSRFGSGHLGAIDCYNDGTTTWIYAALEQPNQVLIVDTTFKDARTSQLKDKDRGDPPQGDFPWCAINPWNGWLYSSNFLDVSEVYAYDPKMTFATSQA